jgi:hypothetical protein
LRNDILRQKRQFVYKKFKKIVLDRSYVTDFLEYFPTGASFHLPPHSAAKRGRGTMKRGGEGGGGCG